MIFRQLFDHDSYTYTYLLGDESSGKAVLIDPVLDNTDGYLQLLKELGLRLAVAMDTHVHADHITALGALREKTGCTTYLGNPGEVNCADHGFNDGDVVDVGSIAIQVMYTPGHTDDSYSFLVNHDGNAMVFTGDTLLIRGSGRTDFQNGDPSHQYHSLHDILMRLPESTVVYPAHDYKGWTRSSIGEEKQHNPRINITSESEFVEFMNSLDLPDPKWMDVAVPANRSCGKA